MTASGSHGNDKIKTYRVVVKGEVTGVGFRYSTVREARKYSALRGYVKNKDSRTVECVVQGPAQDVSEFIEWVKHGPSGARVKSADVSPLSMTRELPPFQIEF